jgi:predicted PurR-regulated permease PerM
VGGPRTLQKVETALIWTGMAAAAFLLWEVRQALLIALGSIVLAIMLSEIAFLIGRWCRLGRGPALALATLLVVALIGGTLWLFGTRLSSELSDVLHRVEQSEQQLRGLLAKQGLQQMGQNLAQGGASMIEQSLHYMLAAGPTLAGRLIVLLIAALYMAAQPELYRQGLIQLFAPRLRPKAAEAIDLIGRSLRLWLAGQLILMILVGVLSFLATLLIGLPSPAALGLIAGITEAIPYVGPFIGGIPAVLVALTQGATPALWTIGAFLGIHVLEGYLVAPLIQRWFVTIPPALVLIALVVAGMLFGWIGIVFATPLTVVCFMAVKVLYVRDTLKQPTPMPGEEQASSPS